MPTVFDGGHHGVVVVGIVGSASETVTTGNHEADDVASTGIGVAATAGVAEAVGTSAGEVAFIPHDEDDGISGPCLGGHDGGDGI